MSMDNCINAWELELKLVLYDVNRELLACDVKSSDSVCVRLGSLCAGDRDRNCCSIQLWLNSGNNSCFWQVVLRTEIKSSACHSSSRRTKLQDGRATFSCSVRIGRRSCWSARIPRLSLSAESVTSRHARTQRPTSHGKRVTLARIGYCVL